MLKVRSQKSIQTDREWVIILTYKVFKTWKVLDKLDFPSFENFVSLDIFRQSKQIVVSSQTVRRVLFPFLRRGILFLFLCLLFSSCDLINPEEGLPAFLQINKFTFTTTTTQGADSEQITDAWVFADDGSLGIYELPATVPVLASGNQNITIFPVIRENGLRSDFIIYPFYERYEVTVNLEAEQTINIQPTTTFIANNTVFELIEDFESNNHGLNGGNPDAVQIVTDATKILDGAGSGQILLNELKEVEFTSFSTFLDLTAQRNFPLYLEMDYKTNVEFEIGLLGIDPNPANPINATNYIVTLCPIDRWNKVYINFQEAIQVSQLPSYKLAFRVSTDDTGCNQIANRVPEVLIDNVKFIRFKN